MIVDQESLRQLGWEQILREVGESVQTERGRALVAQLVPSSKLDEVEWRFAMQSELHWLSETESLNFDLEGGKEVGPLVRRAEKGGLLEGLEVRQCAKVLETFQATRSLAERWAEEMPNTNALVTELARAPSLVFQIHEAIEPSGELRDDASAELGELRRRARQLRGSMKTRVETMLKDEDFRPWLQDDFFTVRGERYVLPVKANSQSRISGVVHHASNSGETVFIEPQELIKLGNELTVIHARILEEEQKILSMFSADLGEFAEEIEQGLDTLGRLDLVNSMFQFGTKIRGRTIVPQRDAPLKLLDARHPILALSLGPKVVANDFSQSSAVRVSVISGPNAGGKTVAMTTVALTLLMSHCGMPVACGAQTSLPWLRGLTSAIGDLQDLSRDLSTFTAHLSRLAEMAKCAAEGWWFFIDEIASGTDPVEGAALARGILEHFCQSGSRCVVTTHLEELKALGITDKRFGNARVGLDPTTMKPTFHLETGAAGTSNALDVAASCGLPTDVLAASRSFLEERGALAIALKQLELEREELQRSKTEVEELKGKLQSQTRHLQRENEELGRRRRGIEAEVRSEFAERIADHEREISDLVREVQSERSMGKAVELQKRLKSDASAQTKEAAKLKASSESTAISPLRDKPKVGQRVFVLTVKQMGEVLEVGGSEATVQVGMLKMRMKFSELALSQKKPPKTSEKLPNFVKPSKNEQAAVLAGKVVSAAVPSRCDLRGQRVLEAREALLQFLDAAFLAPQPRLTIVHGHGSGALKTMVRDLLVSSTIVKDFRSGENNEGGEGVTVVTLDC